MAVVLTILPIVCILISLNGTPETRGAEVKAEPPAVWGTSLLGTAGVRRVSAAHNRGPGMLSLSLEGGIGSASSVLVTGDHLDPPERLFERLRQIAGYAWDEDRRPFHSSYDNW